MAQKLQPEKQFGLVSIHFFNYGLKFNHTQREISRIQASKMKFLRRLKGYVKFDR